MEEVPITTEEEATATDLKQLHKALKSHLNGIDDWDESGYVFELPQSQFAGQKIDVDLNSTFKKPEFNEMASLARDQYGNQRRLSAEQLIDIQQTGGFSVASNDFPGQQYHWEINRAVQKGTTEIGETLKNGIAFATEMFIIVIPNFIWKREHVTIWDSLKSIGIGFIKTILLPIGWIANEKKTVNNKFDLDNIRLELLLSEIFDPTKYDKDGVSFMTRDGLVINLVTDVEISVLTQMRAEYDEFMKGIKANQLMNRSALMQQLTAEYPDETKEQVSKRIADIEATQQQEAIYQFISGKLNDETQKPIAERIIQLMFALKAIRTAIKTKKAQVFEAVELYKEQIKQHYPIRSRISDWFDGKIQDYTNVQEDPKALDLFIQAEIEKCKAQTPGHAYLFEKNLNILRSNEYKAEVIKTKKVPTETFRWNFRIWLPSHWKKTQDEHGRWSVDKYNHYQTTSGFVGWRIVNMFITAGKLISDGTFWMFANFAYGPFGLRSLFGLDDFQPDRTIDSNTGELKHTGSTFRTWFGRIRALWRNIAESRREFKASPDTGFFGKSFTNPFNWLWNYVCKGVVGTAITFIGHFLLTIGSTLVSLLVGMTSFAWGPVLSILKYLWDIIIYDTDSVDGVLPIWNYMIWRVLIRGFGQLLLSTGGIVGSVFLGAVVYALSGLRAGARWLYDRSIFALFIKPFGKVPISSSGTARLVSGPGLSMDHYYRIEPDVVELLVAIQLEKEEVNKYVSFENKRIDGPTGKLIESLSSFGHLGLSIDNNGETLKSFRKTASDLKQRLDVIVRAHWSSLGLGDYRISSVKAGNCRMTTDDLAIVLSGIANMCQTVYNEKIFTYMTEQQIYDMWIAFGLSQNDWSSLGKRHLAEIFGNSILQPIEEVDNAGFQLRINHLDTQKYFKGLWKANIKDDLEDFDVVGPVVDNDSIPASNIVLISPYDIINLHGEDYEKAAYLRRNDVDEFIKKKNTDELQQVLLE